MDGVNFTPRESLRQIADECEHVLHERLARGGETRGALKALERRASALIKSKDGRAFDAEFEKVVATADSVFGAVVIELRAAGYAAVAVH